MATILVVDDNEDVAETVSINLKEAGHHAITAPTLHQARQEMQDRGDSFNGAIVDIWMTNGTATDNGLHFAEELSRRSPPIPFVVISGGGPGKTLESVAARADSLGAVAVLFKPFDDDELMAAVKSMLDHHH